MSTPWPSIHAQRMAREEVGEQLRRSFGVALQHAQCDALAWLPECRLHVPAAMRSREGPPSHPDRSGPSAPVFDAVMVGCEAVADAP